MMKKTLFSIIFLSALCCGCGDVTDRSAQDADSLSLDTAAVAALDTTIVLPVGEYHLLAMDSLIVNLSDLKNKTIGINSRRNGGFILLDSILVDAKFAEGDCFGIPVEDINLRLQMLHQNLIDAAFLPPNLSDSARQTHGAHLIRIYQHAE